MEITIVGIGYIGLALAVSFAEAGHSVICLDDDKEKIERLKRGQSPFYEQNVEEKLLSNKNKLNFTTDCNVAFANANVIMITQPAPINEDGSTNLEGIYNIVMKAARYITNDCFVIIKSDVPIGTVDQAETIMIDHLVHNVHVEFIVNPDFLRLGTATSDFKNASHIVIGIESEAAEEMMRKVYGVFDIPFVIIDRRSAELVKFAANGLLSVQNAFLREMAELCEVSGANIEEIARGMNLDSRRLKQIYQLNLGYGEHRYIKENQALNRLSFDYGLDMKTMKAAIEVSEIEKRKFFNKGKRYYPNYSGVKIAMLGVSFNGGTDFFENSPTSVIEEWLSEGGEVRVWDPIAHDYLKNRLPDKITFCNTIEEALFNADICFIVTKYPEIKYIDVYDFANYMHVPIVIDGWNCYSLCDIEEAGIVYDSIGRNTVDGRDNT